MNVDSIPRSEIKVLKIEKIFQPNVNIKINHYLLSGNIVDIRNSIDHIIKRSFENTDLKIISEHIYNIMGELSIEIKASIVCYMLGLKKCIINIDNMKNYDLTHYKLYTILNFINENIASNNVHFDKNIVYMEVLPSYVMKFFPQHFVFLKLMCYKLECVSYFKDYAILKFTMDGMIILTTRKINLKTRTFISNFNSIS